jgi:uncharacterized protein with NRDE domain
MCLILFSYNTTPGYRLILAANRDEFFSRPTASLDWWDDDKTILGGRDLQAGGTWLGVNRRGDFGALTNYRETGHETGHNSAAVSSRGEILHHFLRENGGCPQFLETLAGRGGRYRGFSLLLGGKDGLFYYSNRSEKPNQSGAGVAAGIYGLSNHLIDSSWPKVERGKMLLEEVLRKESFTIEALFGVLGDTVRPPLNRLPKTGVGEEWEKVLAPIFIHSEGYGTRSSAILTIADDGAIQFHERTYIHDAGGVYSDIVKSL